MNKNLNTLPNKTKQESDIEKLTYKIGDGIYQLLKDEEENEKEINSLINNGLK